MSVEGSASDAELLEPGTAGTIAHTNHYTSARMSRYEREPAQTAGSETRYRSARRWLARGPVTPDLLRAGALATTRARRTRCAAMPSTEQRRKLSFGALPTSQKGRSVTVVGTRATRRSSVTPLPEPSTHRYAQLTWPQVAEWAARDPVCVIPVATLEDHGYHLPIDTDVVIAETLADRAVQRCAGRSLLLPTVTHGYTPHHMDFPGPITIDWKTFVDGLLDIGRSLLRHRFSRILFVNGHGSNVPLVDMAARLLMVERADAIAASFWYLSGPDSAELLRRTRDSDAPGGMAHACELETSLYLAIQPDRVQMDKAVREIPDWGSENVWMDWNDGPLSIKGAWSGWTESGVMGDATVATPEKGRLWLERAIAEVAEYIDELAVREPRPGRDHHNDAASRLPSKEESR